MFLHKPNLKSQISLQNQINDDTCLLLIPHVHESLDVRLMATILMFGPSRPSFFGIFNIYVMISSPISFFFVQSQFKVIEMKSFKILKGIQRFQF